jgi:hypothetical protein
MRVPTHSAHFFLRRGWDIYSFLPTIDSSPFHFLQFFYKKFVTNYKKFVTNLILRALSAKGISSMSAIHHVTDLSSLQQILKLKRGVRVSVSLPFVPCAETDPLETRINKLVSECGCNTSASALLAAVAACILTDVIFRSAIAGHIWSAIGLNLLACFLIAGLGKCYGLLRARVRLARIVEAVRRQNL